jgi:hypothetical protein
MSDCYGVISGRYWVISASLLRTQAPQLSLKYIPVEIEHFPPYTSCTTYSKFSTVLLFSFLQFQFSLSANIYWQSGCRTLGKKDRILKTTPCDQMVLSEDE